MSKGINICSKPESKLSLMFFVFELVIDFQMGVI